VAQDLTYTMVFKYMEKLWAKKGGKGGGWMDLKRKD